MDRWIIDYLSTSKMISFLYDPEKADAKFALQLALA
jgi:hypothetical protein